MLFNRMFWFEFVGTASRVTNNHLAGFPLDPMLSKALLAAETYKVRKCNVVIVSAILRLLLRAVQLVLQTLAALPLPPPAAV
jgi:hypothetical protein